MRCLWHKSRVAVGYDKGEYHLIERDMAKLIELGAEEIVINQSAYDYLVKEFCDKVNTEKTPETLGNAGRYSGVPISATKGAYMGVEE